MPDESKGPDPVSPMPGGGEGAPHQEAKSQSEQPASSAAPETKSTEKPEEAKAAAPAKPAAPAAAKPGAPESAEAKPPAPAAAKPVDAAKPSPAAPAAKPAAPAAAAAKPAAPAAAKPAAPAKPAGPAPEPWDSELTRSLKKQYGSGIKEASTYVGQKYVVVASEIVREVLLRMRDEEGYDYCVDITAVHYPKREAQFELVYILYSFHHNQRVRVKAQISEGQHVRSAVDIWPTANWLEREVYDMFGIQFDGHPDLKRILMPDGWKGHPLRKDYDILQQDKEWVKINIGIESGQ